MSNVVEVVVADKNLATMSRSVKATGLDMVLSKAGPFTIFAPTEIAFGKLRSGRMQDLLKTENKEKLTALLNGHVVEGLINFADLRDNDKLATMSGSELSVKVRGGTVIINGAIVLGRDSAGSNGVVHSLDTVIEAK